MKMQPPKLVLLLLLAGAAMPSVTVAAVAETTPSRAAVVALSSLGDITSFKTIAVDTLAIVNRGDITAARARIKDLETSWDQAESTLKPKDMATWTKLDGMIDAVLGDLRTPGAKPSDCAASLKALIVRMDAINKA